MGQRVTFSPKTPLNLNIKQVLKSYYESDYIIHNGIKTRTNSITSNNVIISGNKVEGKFNFNRKNVHYYLSYFNSLFNWDYIKGNLIEFNDNYNKNKLNQIKEQLEDEDEDNIDENKVYLINEYIKTVENNNLNEFNKLNLKVKYYLDKCEYRFINLNSIFNIFNK